ncbi:unnamed protein product [Caretta caretta]
MTFASFQGLEEGTKGSEQEQQNRTTEERKVPTGETEVGIWSLDAKDVSTGTCTVQLYLSSSPNHQPEPFAIKQETQMQKLFPP